MLFSFGAYAGYFSGIKDRIKDYNKKYFLYVNKTEKKLYLMDRTLKVWKGYTVATGENDGEKIFSGDKRTPTGVYKVTEICQYREPWYLPQLREKMKAFGPDTKEHGYYSKYYQKYKEIYMKTKQRIKGLNGIYLSAREGHTKYKTNEDLGYNAYGPVFIRLDYPNDEDIKKYNDAVKKGLVPVGNDGNYADPGSGVAIHGTNDDPSLGNNASNGCVRMENKDIDELSDYVSEGTMVVIE